MTDLAPPANRRCQIYTAASANSSDLVRCRNEGTHWEKWAGCQCIDKDDDMCADDFYSWECDGHQGEGGEAA